MHKKYICKYSTRGRTITGICRYVVIHIMDITVGQTSVTNILLDLFTYDLLPFFSTTYSVSLSRLKNCLYWYRLHLIRLPIHSLMHGCGIMLGYNRNCPFVYLGVTGLYYPFYILRQIAFLPASVSSFCRECQILIFTRNEMSTP